MMPSETAGFGKFAASPYNNFIAICDAAVRSHVGADADGIFVSYTPDTLHYAGVNLHSLRLVATDRRLRRRASRRNTAPASGCDKYRFVLLAIASIPIPSPRLLSHIRYGETSRAVRNCLPPLAIGIYIKVNLLWKM